MSKMENSTLSQPVLDWPLTVKLSNHSEELAKKLVALFLEHLPESKEKIIRAYNENNIQTLIEEVHKLHGGCCYCGVPRLKEIVMQFESALKRNEVEVFEPYFKRLMIEIEAVSQAINDLLK